MTRKDIDAKVASLLAEADQQRQHGHLQVALQCLQEASHLDAANDDIKNALKRLQLTSSTDDFDKQLQDFASSGNPVALQSLLQALTTQDTLSSADAERCLETALQHDCQQDAWAKIIHKLATSQREGRRSIAQRMTSGPNGIFGVLLCTSDRTSKAVLQVLFDAAIWPSQASQTAAQQAIFRKCSLEQTGVNAAQATELILRQLIMSPIAIADQVDEPLIRRLLALLDIRESQSSRGQALLAISKLHGTAQARVEPILTRLLASYATSASSSKHIIGFSAAAALFPVMPSICASLLLTEGFLPGLTPLLRGSRISEVDDRETSDVQQSLLEVLSAACVDKTCSEAIGKHCQASLKERMEKGSTDENSSLAALVLSKLSGNSTDVNVVSRLIDVLRHDTADSSLAVEGLAYASLSPVVKERIVKDDKLLIRLIASLGQQKYTLSTLTILANIAGYRPARSEEQKRMAQIKAYANSSKLAAEDPLDNNGMVSIRCMKLLNAGVITSLVACLKDLKTIANLDLVAKIINSTAREAKHRTRIVQEGGVKLLLHISNRLHDLQDKGATITQRVAAHALARVLISVNPAHVFNTALPITTAVSTLLPLLDTDEEQEERDLLPTFEALLALTNLASMGDTAVCDLIIRKGWTKLEDQHLLSGNNLIQRASVELICNLMLSPSGVAKFADGSEQAARRLHILLALADVEDLATRRAAGGALAMLTEWDTAVTAIIKVPRGMKILLSMCADSQDDMKHRGIVCALNCASMPGEIGTASITSIRAENGITILNDALKSTKSTDVLAAGRDLLQVLR